MPNKRLLADPLGEAFRMLANNVHARIGFYTEEKPSELLKLLSVAARSYCAYLKIRDPILKSLLSFSRQNL